MHRSLPLILALALVACSSDDPEDCVLDESGECEDAGLCADGDEACQDEEDEEERIPDPCIPQTDEAFWGDNGFEPGTALDVPHDGEWHFVPIEGMKCGDGEPTGIFVNFVEESEDFFLFLQGGGICYNNASCGLMEGNLSGPRPGNPNLGQDFANSHQRGFFNRDDPENPMRNANMVSIPHCTGDFHLSACLNDYTNVGKVHQVGRENLKRALKAVVPSVDNIERALVAGFSAGGVGVTGNFHLIAEAFETRFAPEWTLIMDGGPLFPKPHFSEAGQQAILEKWDIGEYIGSFCESCLEDGFHKLYETNHELHPNLRSAVVCSYSDSVAFALYGLINNNLGLLFSNPLFFKNGLLDLAAKVDEAGYEDHVQFLYEGARHGAIEFWNFDETPLPQEGEEPPTSPTVFEDFIQALFDRDAAPFSYHE